MLAFDQCDALPGASQPRARRRPGLTTADDQGVEACGHGGRHDAPRYLARTVEVTESTTIEAIANCGCRSVMPWRRAIHAKSV